MYCCSYLDWALLRNLVCRFGYGSGASAAVAAEYHHYFSRSEFPFVPLALQVYLIYFAMKDPCLNYFEAARCFSSPSAGCRGEYLGVLMFGFR